MRCFLQINLTQFAVIFAYKFENAPQPRHTKSCFLIYVANYIRGLKHQVPVRTAKKLDLSQLSEIKGPFISLKTFSVWQPNPWSNLRRYKFLHSVTCRCEGKWSRFYIHSTRPSAPHRRRNEVFIDSEVADVTK